MVRRWFWVLISIVFVALLTPMAVWAVPPLPFSPWGSVILNGAYVPDGTEIRAFCDGVMYGYAQTYTYLGESFYDMHVAGDDPETPAVKEGCTSGETVTFTVANVVADQTHLWSGGSQQLNLTATKPIPDVAIQKKVDGHDADSPPGPNLMAGSDLTWSYHVVNTGETVLADVIVTDDNGTPDDTSDDFQVCGPFTMAVGAEQTCTQPGVVQIGPFVNTATVTGSPPGDDPPVSDRDVAHYFGINLQTSLVKYTNDQDSNQPPGELLEVGGNVTWTYVIENSGNVDLYDVTVVDDMGTPGDTADDETVCTIAVLPAGATDDETCVMTGYAVPGLYRNLAVVTGTPPDGLGDVTDDDVSHYFGSAPAIVIVKKTNGSVTAVPTDLYIEVGEAVTWTYELTNTGNVVLENIVVRDDNGTSDPLDDLFATCTLTTLDPPDDPEGASTTVCSISGHTASPGAYHNVATVTADPPVGSLAPVSAHSYYFGAFPAITLQYAIDDAAYIPGQMLYVGAGSDVKLDYLVTNTGNVPLENIVITDTLGSVCGITSLATGASQSCSKTIPAQTGQHNLAAAVTASPPGGLGNITANSNAVSYFGATLGLGLVKRTNGQIVTEPTGLYVLTGSTVNWSYQLTNTSNVTLSNIRVMDDNGTPANPADDHEVCPGITLEPGATHTCYWSKAAGTGAYTNVATASGNPPAPLAALQATHSSHHFGTSIDLTFVKHTNGIDAKTGTGPLVAVGGAINWTYTVNSTSNVPLTFSVVDNPAAPITCDKTSLNTPTDEVVCYGTDNAVAGQFENTATLTAVTPGNLDDIILTDTSHYYGVTTGITLEKLTNNEDADTGTGPVIKVGEPVTWSYVITNTGNVELTSISVVDDQEGSIPCPSTLAAGATMTCTKARPAEKGQYSNLATVTASPPAGFDPVSDDDPSHYFGSDAGVKITKLTNGIDIDVGDPPFILVGEPVSWSYVVKNLGNIPLNQISVTDSDPALIIDCPGTSLPAGGEMTCTAQGTAAAGAYSNTGYVQGLPEGFDTVVTSQDDSGYYGANPVISITKYTEGFDAKTPEEAPYIPVEDPVQFEFQIVTSEENYLFTDILVTDDSGETVICPKLTLGPGEDTMVCTATGTAAAGLQNMAGHVSAKVVAQGSQTELGTVTASDPSHYFGYFLGLDLAKYTNDQVVNEPPGPNLVVGQEVTWTYEVTNTSNVSLNDVVLLDDPEGNIICPAQTLDPSASMRCEKTGIVGEGGYHNTAIATGKFAERAVQSPQAESFYYGTYFIQIRQFLPMILR
jgi:uncharacterized repeat protein (TIGR01451 family)